MHDPEIFARENDVTGESPLWSAREQALFWIDIGTQQLRRKAISDVETRTWALPDRPGCVAELENGELAIAMGEGVHRFDMWGGRFNLLSRVRGKRAATRFNDGKVDPKGRFWVSTMQNNFGPNGERLPLERWDGALFRIDPDCEACLIEGDLGCPNTLAWSPDQRRFYFADSLRDEIYLYDFDRDSGSVINKRLFFSPNGLGLPDGSAIDVDGCLWNARYDAGAVVRITPEGVIDRHIALPVPRPTSCIFGGPRLDILFITSARNGLSRQRLEAVPLSGSVLALVGAAQGLPVSAMRAE